MTTFLSIVISNITIAAVLAVAALAITRVWRDPHLAHALWLLVLLKLVTPPLVLVPRPTWDVSTTSVETSGAPSVVPASDTNVASQLPKKLGRESVPGNTDRRATAGRVAFDASALLSIVLMVWTLGTVSYVIIIVTRCVRFSRLLKRSVEAPDRLAASAALVADRIGLRRLPPIRVVDESVPPLVWCVGWKPLVLLPALLFNRLDGAQQQAVLAHEFAHIKRMDHRLRWLEVCVLALFWWYPVAWWAAQRLRWAEDECCDAWVVWVLPSSRRSYGQALLQTVEYVTESNLPIPRLARCVSSGTLLKRRIEMIMSQEPKPKMTRATLAVVLTLSMLVLPTAAESRAVVDRKSGPKQVAKEKRSDRVRLSQNNTQHLEEDFRFRNALIVPRHDVRIPSRTSGVIEQLSVKKGATVEKGQLLAQIDQRGAELNLAKAKAEAAAAVQGISKYERAALDRIFELEQSKLEEHSIKAPIGGVVVELLHSKGEWVEKGQPICRIIDLHQMAARASVPVSHRHNLAGRTVHLIADPNDRRTISATITYVSPIVEPDGRVIINCEFENVGPDGDPLVYPGMSVEMGVMKPQSSSAKDNQGNDR